jgi:hypothetical protein
VHDACTKGGLVERDRRAGTVDPQLRLDTRHRILPAWSVRQCQQYVPTTRRSLPIPWRAIVRTSCASNAGRVNGSAAPSLSPKRAAAATAPLVAAAAGWVADLVVAWDCDEGGPPRWHAGRVIEKRVQGGPSSCCTLDWI